MNRTGWKWIGLAILVVAILVFARLWFSKHERQPSPTGRTLIQADVIMPGLEEVPITRETTGVVAPSTSALLASKTTGLVEEVRVKEGARVQAGHVLIVLDQRDLLAQSDRAQAEWENAAVHYQRMKQLYQEESVAKQEVDNAERAFKVAEAAKKEIEANLTYTVIKAPFDGMITEKMIELGELVTPGKPLLRIEDDRPMRLEATVAETDIGAVHLGEKVTVKVDALGDQALTGRVDQILPSADPASHSFTVKVDLPRLSGLRSGLFGRMILTTGLSRRLMLPSSAVMEKGGLAYVYAVNADGIVESRPVKLGKRYKDRVEVLSGLEEGEQILAEAKSGREGAQIRIIKNKEGHP